MYTNKWLCIQEIKGESEDTGAQSVVANGEYLMKSIPEVEAWIDKQCEQSFAPRVESKFLDVSPNVVDLNLNQINLMYPWLEISSVKVDGDEITAWDYDSATRSDSDYYPTPRNQYPMYTLQGLQSRVWIPDDVTHFIDGIEIEGISGYRSQYPSEGWKSTGQTIQNEPLDNSGTLIAITDDTTLQFNGGPVFSECQLLRAETEIMYLWAIESGGLRVERGVRGSTKVQHVKNTPIEVWNVESQIERAATRWAVYMAKRRATYDTLNLDAGSAGKITISMPSRMPEEVEAILDLMHNPSNKLMGV